MRETKCDCTFMPNPTKKDRTIYEKRVACGNRINSGYYNRETKLLGLIGQQTHESGWCSAAGGGDINFGLGLRPRTP